MPSLLQPTPTQVIWELSFSGHDVGRIYYVPGCYLALITASRGLGNVWYLSVAEISWGGLPWPSTLAPYTIVRSSSNASLTLMCFPCRGETGLLSDRNNMSKP